MPDFIEQYFWHLMALLGSPYVGFAAGQRYKRYLIAVGQKQDALFGIKVANVAGMITSLFTFACWYQVDFDIAQSVILGGMVGVTQVSIVKLLIGFLKKNNPEMAEELVSGSDITYVPWGKRKDEH